MIPMPEPSALPLAAGLLATLAAAAAVLAAVALGAVAAMLYGRRGASGADPADGSVAAQLQAIGDKIDRTITEQRRQGETDRRLITQKLTGVSETVDAQGHELAGLRNELRHEVRRRDTELDELRHQVAAMRAGGALPASTLGALPPAATDELLGDPSGDGHGTDEDPVLTADEVSYEPETPSSAITAWPDPVDIEADPFEVDHEDDEIIEEAVDFEALDALVFEAPVHPALGRAETAPAAPESDEDEGAPAAPSIFTPISFGPPSATPPEPSAWVARPSEDQAEAVAAAPEDVVRAAFPAPEAPSAPEGAEDLTVISSVDESTQAFLYSAGVLTLDDVARIGRSDAQRLGHGAGVSEHTIMDQWVFEAQAALFDRFSKQSRP